MRSQPAAGAAGAPPTPHLPRLLRRHARQPQCLCCMSGQMLFVLHVCASVYHTRGYFLMPARKAKNRVEQVGQLQHISHQRPDSVGWENAMRTGGQWPGNGGVARQSRQQRSGERRRSSIQQAIHCLQPCLHLDAWITSPYIGLCAQQHALHSFNVRTWALLRLGGSWYYAGIHTEQTARRRPDI